MNIACTKFTIADLPIRYQTREIERLIGQMTERVVYVRAESKRGSGIVFKRDNDYYVQTCSHVVKENETITVIFGNTVNNISRSTIAKRIGSCLSQDKAIYRLNSNGEVPSCYTEMRDVKDLVVDIKFKNQRRRRKALVGRRRKALVEYDMSGNQYVIHSPIPYSHADKASEYSVHFQNGTSAVCTDIAMCNTTCSQLHIDPDSVPNQTKELFHLEPPWPYDSDWVVVLISFPKSFGKVKHISLGQPYSDDAIGSAEDLDLQDAMIVNHTADSCGGSSGGCVKSPWLQIIFRYAYRTCTKFRCQICYYRVNKLN